MLNKAKTWAQMIKIEHTLFALPFTLSAALLAIYDLQVFQDQAFKPISFLWIFICFLGVRSAGMTLNRLIDAKIDAKNPRTKDREIPKGKISKTQAIFFTGISLALLIFGAFQLPKLCQILLPIPIIWVIIYPYLKRFTYFCHFFLGSTLGGAALGGWIAITGTIENLAPIYFALAVTTWVSGFDIIYACQDYEHDIKNGIHSIPAKFGIKAALQISRFLHFLSPLFLYLTGRELMLGIIYKTGVMLVIAALFYEQKLVQDAIDKDDCKKLNKAFFTVNSWISILILLFVVLEVF